jgi:hypothetical protein
MRARAGSALRHRRCAAGGPHECCSHSRRPARGPLPRACKLRDTPTRVGGYEGRCGKARGASRGGRHQSADHRRTAPLACLRSTTLAGVVRKRAVEMMQTLRCASACVKARKPARRADAQPCGRAAMRPCRAASATAAACRRLAAAGHIAQAGSLRAARALPSCRAHARNTTHAALAPPRNERLLRACSAVTNMFPLWVRCARGCMAAHCTG